MPFRNWLRPIFYLGSNPLSQLGVVVATASAITLSLVLAAAVAGVEPSPYAGIIAFLVLPGVFIAGLALIPFGIWLRRRREVVAGRLPSEYPPIDLRQGRTRETLLFILVMTGVNAALFLGATYHGVHVMESVQFCGTTCHSVMQPEYTAYQAGAHARVACVDCHIGPGASWFVRSKLSGTWQVISVNLDLYPRPIPTPVHNLRPSRETCERCHWPEMFVGDRLIVRTHFTDEEEPAPRKTVLLMHTGGLDRVTGKPLGNHGVHLQPGATIRYAAADETRQEIPYVRYTQPDGTVTEYFAGDAETPPPEKLRVMDCIDCHNRPAHRFDLPDRAVDRALDAGRLDRSLPWIRHQALALLQAEYPSHDAAGGAIRKGLQDFYRAHYPAIADERRTTIDAAADTLADVYRHNVFPQMAVTWGTYPVNIGHDPAPGCFRCHDGSHKSRDGKTINDDCTACHGLLAVDEAEPKVLEQLAGG